MNRKPMLYDYILVFNDGSAQRMRQVPYLGGLSRYEVAGRSRHFVLFKLQDSGHNP